MKKTLIPIALVAWAFVSTTSAAAAEDRPHSLVLYGLGAFIDGDVTYGEVDNQVDIDADDVVDSLEAAAFARYRHQNERWAFAFDGQFAGLGDSAEEGPVRTDVNFDLYVFQGDVAYRFSETAEALAGVRYVRFESEADVHFAGDGTIHRENDSSFWDPVIGVRTLTTLSDRIGLQAQGDIGGGANMDFTWQAMVHVGYLMNEDVSFWFGYRALAMEFDDSGGRNRVDADLMMHGPEAGIAFHF
jgi:hypothetical protein